jgi:N-acetylneuraminic acid mutarotase
MVGCSPAQPPVWVPGWLEAPSTAVARTGAKAVVAGDRIYVMGGGEGIPGPDTIHKSVEYTRIRFDGGLDPWRMTRPMNTPRMFQAAVEFQGVIYALGGEYFPGGQMKLLNSVEYARVGRDGQLEPWVSTSPMNTPRRSPTAAVAEGYLWAIGGYNGIFLETVERARIREGGDLGPWEMVPQRLTTARYIHGGATRGDRIYVFGGHLQESGRGSSDAEWTTVGFDGQLSPWRATSSLLQPRFLAGSAASEEFVFIVGGYDGKYLASVESARILPDGELSPWVQAVPLSTPREGAAVVVHANRIYVIGGSNSGTYLRTVEQAVIAADGRLGYWSSVQKQGS